MTKTKKDRKIHLDILIIFLLIMATFIFAITPIFNNSIVRAIIGIPVALFIPGYMTMIALFPKRDDLEIIDRITMSLGVSIAILSIIGLLLNFTVGIRLMTILIAISIYVIIFMFVTMYRRRKLSKDTQFSIIQPDELYNIVFDKLKPKNRIDLILTIILIFVSVLAIGTVFYVVTTPKMDERFTEFYILNSSGMANYQTDLKLDSSNTFMVGIANHEYSYVNYTIQITLDKNVLDHEELILNHDEIWKENITFVPDRKGNDMKLEFLLFKEDNLTTPYRSLYLWVNVT